MHPILKNILIEISVVASVFIIGFISGCEESVLFIKYSDIGTIIAGLGIVWFIGTTLRITPIWEFKATTMIISLAMALSGYALQSYGLFHAFLTLGVFFVVMAIISSNISVYYAKIFLVIGVILIPIGYIGKPLSVPTKYPDLSSRYVDVPDARWRVIMGIYKLHDRMPHYTEVEIVEIQGDENSAIQQAKEIIRKRNIEIEEENNKHKPGYGYRLASCELSTIYLPKWYIRKYGGSLPGSIDIYPGTRKRYYD